MLETIQDIINLHELKNQKEKYNMFRKGEPSVDIKILDDRLYANMPEYATVGSAGIDLMACITEPLKIYPNETHLIGTGFAAYIKDPNFAGIILPRSGLGHKKGLVLGNLVGLIDSDYQGELKVSLWNRSNDMHIINRMDRIAQLVIIPVQQVHFNVVSSFEESDRGEGGFGSTGVSTSTT